VLLRSWFNQFFSQGYFCWNYWPSSTQH